MTRFDCSLVGGISLAAMLAVGCGPSKKPYLYRTICISVQQSPSDPTPCPGMRASSCYPVSSRGFGGPLDENGRGCFTVGGWEDGHDVRILLERGTEYVGTVEVPFPSEEEAVLVYGFPHYYIRFDGQGEIDELVKRHDPPADRRAGDGVPDP